MVKQLVVDGQVQIQAFKSSYDYFSNEAIEVAKLLFSKQQISQVGDWPPCSITFIELDESPYSSLETKEGINLYISMLSMLQKEVTWSLIIYATVDRVKVSARSIPGSVNVRRLMETLDLGSGHDRAAGGSWENKDAKAGDKVKDLLEWLENNSPLYD